jgi:hypothetical protein
MRKWKPTKAQKDAFIARMNNPMEKAAYEERKTQKAEKRRADSKYDYDSAGGYYKATETQYKAACSLILDAETESQKEACNMVIMAYNCGEKCHHDHIHVINEHIRNTSSYRFV